jgi:hypothetical protein
VFRFFVFLFSPSSPKTDKGLQKPCLSVQSMVLSFAVRMLLLVVLVVSAYFLFSQGIITPDRVSHIMYSENQTVSLVEKLADTEAIFKSAVAFANTDGGTIYIGIRKDGTVVGEYANDAVLADFSKEVGYAGLYGRGNYSPEAAKITKETIEGKPVIKLLIPPEARSPTALHRYNGIAYIRVNTTNKALGYDEESQYIRLPGIAIGEESLPSGKTP